MKASGELNHEPGVPCEGVGRASIRSMEWFAELREGFGERSGLLNRKHGVGGEDVRVLCQDGGALCEDAGVLNQHLGGVNERDGMSMSNGPGTE